MNGNTQMSTKTYNICQEKTCFRHHSNQNTSKETKNHTLLNPQQPHSPIFALRHSFHLQPLPISWDPMRIKVQSCHDGMTRAGGLSHHGILWIVLSHGLAHASQITSRGMGAGGPQGCDDDHHGYRFATNFGFLTAKKRLPPSDSYMGISKNRGTPKWMVYNGKPLLKWMIWGYLYFRKHPYDNQFFSSQCQLSTFLPYFLIKPKGVYTSFIGGEKKVPFQSLRKLSPLLHTHHIESPGPTPAP